MLSLRLKAGMPHILRSTQHARIEPERQQNLVHRIPARAQMFRTGGHRGGAQGPVAGGGGACDRSVSYLEA